MQHVKRIRNKKNERMNLAALRKKSQSSIVHNRVVSNISTNKMIVLGNCRLDLYDKMGNSTSIVYVSQQPIKLSKISFLAKKVACVLTKMPSATLRRLGDDIICGNEVEESK